MPSTDTPTPPPSAGRPAPDFTLQSTSGSAVTLSSFRRETSVLLAFFPLAFTSTCGAEMCSFTDDYDRFAELAVTVLPVSVDSVPTLREFRAKLGLRVELLSDFKRDVSRLYGVLNEEAYVARRSYFLVDRDGILRWSHVETVLGERRGNAELFEHIAQLP